MKMPFAAVHESASGTFETCQPALNMSGYRVPEVTGRRSKRRF
jgi:hypothetical protein